jgi:two-component system response regulator HydG
LIDRRKDIPLLIAHFVKLLSARDGRKAPQLTRKALRALYDYHYPGNVRELRNIIERAFVLCSGDLIDLQHLPPEVVQSTTAARIQSNHAVALPSERRIAEAAASVRSGSIDRPEMRRLLSILEANGWNRTTTAKELGIGRTTLWRRMKDYGLV